MIARIEPLFKNQPAGRMEIQRMIVDGNFAAVHVRAKRRWSDPGTAIVDIYRVKDGRIVEHWDVLQDVPKKAANAHPMF